jgi:hypothetical protein
MKGSFFALGKRAALFPIGTGNAHPDAIVNQVFPNGVKIGIGRHVLIANLWSNGKGSTSGGICQLNTRS